MNKRMNSLGFRLIMMTGGLVFILIAAISVIIFAINRQDGSSLVINLAGRQRMLSQKYTKEILADEINRAASIKAGNAAANTQKLFEITLDALTNGGTSYMDLGMTQSVIVPDCTVPEIDAQLAKVKSIWTQFQKDVASLISEKPATEQYRIKQEKVIAESNIVLKNMNAAVLMFQKNTEQKMAVAKNLLYVSVGIAVVGFTILCFYISNKVIKPLKHISEDLCNGSRQVSLAAEHLSNASQRIANGSIKQAGNLNETTSMLSEMSDQTQNNSQSAQKANSLSSNAMNVARSGNETMVKMDQAINDIYSTAEKTAQILKVIDEIAFQTNLLALNAAVEAARAGESGKGFAVVAEEVRNLALRSAEAASDTSTMIQESLDRAKLGVEISGGVAKGLNDVVAAIVDANSIMDEICSVSIQQASSVSSIGERISDIEEVTKDNSAFSEETAASSEELHALAENLDKATVDLNRMVG